MVMLADQVDVVIGVDTHKQTHTAAVVDRLGGVGATFEFTADRAGYRSVLRRVVGVDAPRVRAVEGTGSYGAGLTEFLHAAGEHVVEVERPARPARRLTWGRFCRHAGVVARKRALQYVAWRRDSCRVRQDVVMPLSDRRD